MFFFFLFLPPKLIHFKPNMFAFCCCCFFFSFAENQHPFQHSSFSFGIFRPGATCSFSESSNFLIKNSQTNHLNSLKFFLFFFAFFLYSSIRQAFSIWSKKRNGRIQNAINSLITFEWQRHTKAIMIKGTKRKTHEQY